MVSVQLGSPGLYLQSLSLGIGDDHRTVQKSLYHTNCFSGYDISVFHLQIKGGWNKLRDNAVKKLHDNGELGCLLVHCHVRTMSQPKSDLPLISDTSCWSTNTKLETEIRSGLYRSTCESEGGKCVPCPLRPAPLFRSIGLTGLSASLPPHRRLRSILHRAQAARPDNVNADETNKVHHGPKSNTLISEASNRGLPFKDFMPDIMTQKLHPPETHQEMRTRGSCLFRDTETFSHFQSQTGSGLNPNNDLTCQFQTCHIIRHQNPPSKTYMSRRTIMSPLTPSETHSVATAETPPRANRQTWSRKIRQILTSEEGSDEQDISESFHSLVLTDDRPSANRKNLQASGSPNSNISELDGEREGKESCHTRRDRRPHFLPPISQSGCLLDVLFIPPENSPPPSPSGVFSTPFFLLSVPALPVRPQHGHRDT